MSASRPAPLRAVLVSAFYLATFAMCLIGATGVILVMAAILAFDLVLGALGGDLRSRLRRPRW